MSTWRRTNSVTKDATKCPQTIEGLNAQIEGHPASAVSRVSQDVLQEIFLACLPASYSDTSLDPRGAPLLLCHICGTWRAVALAFPRLWTSLHINTSHVLKNRQRVSAVEQWLQRSVPFPHSLTLWAPEGVPPSFYLTSTTLALCQTLISVAARWRRLRLLVPAPIWNPLRNIDAPMLDECIFAPRDHGDIGDPWDQEIEEWQLLTGTSLHRFSIHTGPCNLRRALMFPLGWDKLTYLCLETDAIEAGLGVFDVLEVLKRCAAKLVSFKVHLNHDSDQPLVLGEPISLDALESFTILAPCLAPADVLEHLISSLIMPRLLSIQIASNWPGQDDTVFMHNLATRSPLLESLSFDLDGFNRDTLRRTLLMFPRIIELLAIDIDRTFDLAGLPRADGVQLITLLTCLDAAQTNILLPALRSLKIGRCVAVPKAVLVEFIRQRMGKAGGSLCDCTIQFRDPRPDSIPDLQFLVDEGKNLSLKWYEVDAKDAAPSSGICKPSSDEMDLE
ncbi:hypothetical protein C8R43DRAFT_1140084 [Mycena crocata]|nr:hypothetical protein C8R43DRAFT_1140084 [Mycena crocata]